jgi:YD repeat-containing protein
MTLKRLTCVNPCIAGTRRHFSLLSSESFDSPANQTGGKLLRRKYKIGAAGAAALAIVVGAAAYANESITYSYDARGRLVKVERSGGANNGVKADYSYDKANNRTAVTVSGSTKSPPP